MTAAEIARADPEFYEWYRALPVVTEEIPLRDGERPAGAVRVVEFSDFECGHCARASENLKRVLPRFQGRVTVSFRHFPLDQACNSSVSGSFHRYACLAATAAECAAAQGKFWEYHDLLFQNQGGLDRASLLRYAAAVGVDVASFETCLSGDAPREAVRNDVRLGVRLGISSTPTLFLNGRAVRGALEPEKLTYALRLEQEWARQAPR
jgi:protein-disulfide isomerase